MHSNDMKSDKIKSTEEETLPMTRNANELTLTGRVAWIR